MQFLRYLIQHHTEVAFLVIRKLVIFIEFTAYPNEILLMWKIIQ